MRRGILVVAVLATLAGCRDFQVPQLGYHGPLKVVPDTLAVAPQEQATLQVEGGTPPYTIGHTGGTSGSGTDYLAFPLTAKGSGGFANVDGAQVDYSAGLGDGAKGQATADTFVVHDAKGAEVTVHVAIGPPVALTFGSAGAPRAVPTGGTLLLGATGGKSPYLYGLATAASGGSVDAVTGRYHAGPIGCVSDTLLVRDDLGATAAVPVNVECPPRSGSPSDVAAARLADLGSGRRVVYVTNRGVNGGSLEVPVYGGVPLQVPLPGPPVAVTAPNGGGGLVVAVSELDGIHLLSFDAATATSGGTELVPIGTPNYPIPPSSILHLTSGQDIHSIASLVTVATWTTPGGATYGTRMVEGQATATVVTLPAQRTGIHASADATFGALSATGGASLDHVYFYLSPGATGVDAVVDTGGGFGGVAASPVNVSFNTLLGAAGSSNGDVALLGTRPSATNPTQLVPAVVVVTYDPTAGWTQASAYTVVQDGADLIASGHVRDGSAEDYVVAGAGGEVHLVFFGASVTQISVLEDRPTPWFLPPGVSDLFVGDVDGDGLGEILASGYPGQGPTIEVHPSTLPAQSPPSRGVYGAGALEATSVGARAIPGDPPAILAIDAGHFADGTSAPSGNGGELVVVTGGADVGEPVPVKIPVKGAVVTQVISARLRANVLGLATNPSDLVAVVDAGGTTEVWVAQFTRPGLPPDVTALGGVKSPTAFPNAHLTSLRVPGATPPRDAVILVDDAGLRALRWDPAKKHTGLSPVVSGTFGWPARNLGDVAHPDTLVALHQRSAGLMVARIGVDAAGTSLTTTDVPDPLRPKTPLVLTPPAGVDVLHAKALAQVNPQLGQVIALAVGGKILELGTGDFLHCNLGIPGTVSGMAFVRPTSGGADLVAVLDAPGKVLRLVTLFGGSGLESVVDRQALQGDPTSVAVGNVVGGDAIPDIVVGGTPLMVFPGVPDALFTVRRMLSCQ